MRTNIINNNYEEDLDYKCPKYNTTWDIVK